MVIFLKNEETANSAKFEYEKFHVHKIAAVNL